MRSFLFALSVCGALVAEARADPCFDRGVKAVTAKYPASRELFAQAGTSEVLDPLLACSKRGAPDYTNLPNFLHELVHVAGFRVLGIDYDRMRVDIDGDWVRVGSLRTEDDLNDAGFVLGSGTVVVRGLSLPASSVAAASVPEDVTTNPLFAEYLSDDVDFLGLLDELFAYSHQLRFVTKVYPKTIPTGKRTIEKDNVLALQLMVLLYLRAVREGDPTAYERMRGDETLRSLTREIYEGSEAALKAVANEKKYRRIRVAWPAVAKQAARLRPELETFLAAGGGSATAASLTGEYSSTWGPASCDQDGDRVHCAYHYQAGGAPVDGELDCEAAGSGLRCSWQEHEGNRGLASFTVGQDGAWTGTYGYEASDSDGGAWTMSRK